MNIVKKYTIDKTKIRMHDDYLSQDSKKTKETIVSLLINYLNKRNI